MTNPEAFRLRILLTPLMAISWIVIFLVAFKPKHFDIAAGLLAFAGFFWMVFGGAYFEGRWPKSDTEGYIRT